MLRVLLCAASLGQLVLGQAPQVTTSQGTMRGQVLKSRDGRNYFSFTKIPYAKPPLGDLRFKISEKAENWTGVLDATQHIPACSQPNVLGPGPVKVGQEDCLYLNIFTPNLTGRNPVIFSIHGGAFLIGSADFFESAKYFMDENVVFVAPHYRLGPLGIIKACVSQSGVGSSSIAIMKPGSAREMALNLVKAVGCNATADVLKCLQSKPVDQVGNIGLMISNNTPDFTVPVLEPAGAPGALLTRWPTGTDHSYSWIIGVCQDDGSWITDIPRTKEELEKFINGFNQTLISTHNLENRKNDFERLRARYFKQGAEPLTAIRNYYSEYMFVYPALKSLRDHPGPSYFYKFNYTRGPQKPTFKGVPHAAEMPYFFETKSSVLDWPNADDVALSRMLVKMWANFASDQIPSSKGTPTWPQYKGSYYLDIQDSGVTISNWTSNQEILDFWKSIEGSSGSTMNRLSLLFILSLCFFSVFKTILI